MNRQHRTYSQRRRGGRFFGRRANCEYVPQLPAAVVRRVLDDPRNIPYLLIWRNSDFETKEAVRVRKFTPPPQHPADSELVEVKRTDGSRVLLRYAWRHLPRGDGQVLLLMCWHCARFRRTLYAWEAEGQYTNSVRTCDWQCRRCAGLRYASEGGALVLRSRGKLFQLLEMEYGPSRSERPQPWHPYVFSYPSDAKAAGFL